MLDSNTSLAEKLRIFLWEQWILLTTTITLIVGIVSTIVFALLGGGGEGSRGETAPKDKLVAWVKDKLKCLSDALKRLAEKAVAALPGIIGSVFGAVLKFLAKTAGFAVTHVYAFMTLAVGAVAAWLYTTTTLRNKWVTDSLVVFQQFHVLLKIIPHMYKWGSTHRIQHQRVLVVSSYFSNVVLSVSLVERVWEYGEQPTVALHKNMR